MAREKIDRLVWDAVFGADDVKESSRRQIRETALQQGIFPATTQSLYETRGKKLYSGLTVPAMNIRGLTYNVARAVFRAAIEHHVGAFIFEIARSEIGYTGQKPGEYAACVLAAGVREGFRGPVFLQGDHFQFNRGRYRSDPEGEMESIKALIIEAVDATFFNIDIDASTLVDIEKTSLDEQQEDNCRVTAEMTRFIRSIEPKGLTISVGGEIGEVGKKNSTVAELRAFLSGYLSRLGPGIKGISKVSVQTGTTHGGVVLPDGSIAQVEIDFKTLEDLSTIARDEYGMAGAVQHGASTLPEEAFDMFPKVGCAEIHLATGFQNIIYDSPYFPQTLRDKISQHLREKYSNERGKGNTDEQFIYKTRKKAFGDFKKELWSMPENTISRICEALQERFALLFKKLNVVNTADLVNRYVADQYRPKG
ncbi:MAG: class II fructose-bisphosphate aldolase [Chloroflexi bacterium]|nr:class II fructose-bisphosphate aldolase [Chloroflexota bacterium]